MHSPLEEIVEHFEGLAASAGARSFRQDTLNNPLFPGEFNRCMEHGGINRRLQGDRRAQPDHWYAVAPAIRTKDFALAPKGTHATAFEVLCDLEFVPTENAPAALESTSARFLKLLAACGVDRDRLKFTLFGGGEVLGHILEMDQPWTDVWTRLGIRDSQLEHIRGPKLYALFLGEGERAGPRCEVSFVGPTGPVEIGTLIWDRHLLHSAGLQFTFDQPQENAIGFAVGLERLAAVLAGVDLTSVGAMARLLSACRTHNPAEALADDARALADAIKAGLFIEACSRGPLTTEQASFERKLHARIVRKAFLLGLDLADPLWWDAVDNFAGSYPRYPSMPAVVEELRRDCLRVPLETAWNPSGYPGRPSA